ncbi:MAG TPA: hypothetical protein VFZ00_14865 [Solirubrobacter sp.]|nr:hypothetical protein [Solirubrobacter sp.]
MAGTSPGLSDDDGPASDARLNAPYAVAMTRDGGFLITDTDNHRIRRVSPTGTITNHRGRHQQGLLR